MQCEKQNKNRKKICREKEVSTHFKILSTLATKKIIKKNI